MPQQVFTLKTSYKFKKCGTLCVIFWSCKKFV